MMAAGSFHATRTTGTVSVCEIACSRGPTSFISEVPCWRSTHRASKPWRAMTSAVNPWETEIQASVTHWPACHICLILLGRIVAPLVMVIGSTPSISDVPSESTRGGQPRHGLRIGEHTGQTARVDPHDDVTRGEAAATCQSDQSG